MHQFFAFFFFTFIITLIPGPAMIHCVTNSVKGGLRAGLAAAAGVELGVFVYALMSATGLAAILVSVPTVYDVIRLSGVGFLFYMAWNLRPQHDAPSKESFSPASTEASKNPFLSGLMINLLNPKIALVFLTVLPQFTDAAELDTKKILFYGLAFNLCGLIVNLSAALLGSRMTKLKITNRQGKFILSWIPSFALCSLAVVSLSELVLSA